MPHPPSAGRFAWLCGGALAFRDTYLDCVIVEAAFVTDSLGFVKFLIMILAVAPCFQFEIVFKITAEDTDGIENMDASTSSVVSGLRWNWISFASDSVRSNRLLDLPAQANMNGDPRLFCA